MVTAADDDSDPPQLPPALPRIEGTSRRGRGKVPSNPPGRNPPAVAVARTHTSPPARVDVPHPGTRSSGVSSLSSLQLDQLGTPQPSSRPSSLGAGEAGDNETTPMSPDDLPNFAACIQDDDSVASGDDSIGWDKEAERIIGLLNRQAEEEEAAEDNVVGETRAVHEFTTLDGDDRGEEEESVAAPPEIETRRVVFQTSTIKILKEVASQLKYAATGTKRVLFNKLRDCPNVTRDGDDAFEYQHVKEVSGKKVPTWLILNPEKVPDVEGIDMETGADVGFFAPTNKENAVGGKRANFLTQEREKAVDRPIFVPKQMKKRKAGDDDDATPPPVREDGHPSPACRELLPPLAEARPKDFFDTQMTPEFIKWVVDATNLRAYSSGAGSGEYKDYLPFDVDEIYKMFGVLFANGLAPKPQFEWWFKNLNEQPLFGNDFVSRELSKKNHATKKIVSGAQSWRHFRRYFTFQDYRDNPKLKQKTDPLWKVRRLIDHLNKRCAAMWIPGKFLAIDEQTIGFQGVSGLKLRISYKREGDGFQCDAVCDGGYTFSFWFRHGPAPDVGPKYKHLALAPLACRVVWLAERLPNRWTRLYMDNLYNSEKLFSALFIAESLAHGVVRTYARGFPSDILQKEEKNKDRAEKLRGTTMAARLINSDACPDLLAISLYDTKPVHLLSTTASEVRWMVKHRKVWSTAVQKMAMMKYLRLNVIEEYNNNMNSTDIADQLRGNYRPDRWMRQRKWWWSFFIWGLGVASVNAYRIYDVLYEEEKKKNTPGLPRKWTHVEFREQLVYDLIPLKGKRGTSATVSSFASSSPRRSPRRSSASASVTTPTTYDLSSNGGINTYLEEKGVSKITKERLDNGYFRRRFDGLRHDWIPVKNGRCQYCYYILHNEIATPQRRHYTNTLAQNRERIHRCLTCNVNLCPRCNPIFHGVDMSAYPRV